MVDAGAQHRPQQLVPPLVDQVEVHLAERRQEAIGIVQGDRALAVVDLDPVVRHVPACVPGGLVLRSRRALCGCGETTGPRLADPDTLVLVLQRQASTVRGHHGDRARQWLVDPEGDAVTVGVRAQDGVRLPVLAPRQLLDLGDRYLLHRCPSWLDWVGSGGGALSAANGICSQLGRLRASYTHS